VAPPLKGGDLHDSAATVPVRSLRPPAASTKPPVGELDGGMVARSRRQCCGRSKIDSPYERMFE
jgi:hypothetical protein